LKLTALLKTLYAQTQLREYLPGFLEKLSGRFSAEKYAAILKYLAAGHEEAHVEKRPIFERVLLRHLQTIGDAGTEFMRRVLNLNGVRLLSATGTWQSPRRLTLASNGVHPGSVVSPKLESALAHYRRAAAASNATNLPAAGSGCRTGIRRGRFTAARSEIDPLPELSNSGSPPAEPGVSLMTMSFKGPASAIAGMMGSTVTW
jgi:hypothetical protein